MRRINNPPNPYQSQWAEYLKQPPAAPLKVHEEWARSILSENDSPDLPYRWSVNPYRGCQHACSYCYARSYHEHLDLGAGTDFDTQLLVKVNAPQLLRKALRSPKWCGETVHFSGVTDCYQPLEAVYLLTRKCLEVCLEVCNPAAIVTKCYLVVRDAELLVCLAKAARVNVCFSIGTSDDAIARVIEPRAPPPSRRFKAMRRLHELGVPVSIMVAPIIPGLSEQDIPRIIARATECGAENTAFQLLRLPGSVETVFLERLRAGLPLRASRIENRIRELRGGSLTDARFGHRLKGRGAYWSSIVRLFEISCHKYGLNGYLGRSGMNAPATENGSTTPAESNTASKSSSQQLDLPFI